MLPVDENRLFAAHASAVAYIHHSLPTNPNIWVIHYIDRGFLRVYIRSRRRWGSIWAVIALILFCFLLPWAYANTFMKYPCSLHNYYVRSVTPNGSQPIVELVLQMKGCDVEDWLRSPISMICLGTSSFVVVFTLWCAASWLFSGRKAMEKRLHLFMKPFLPRVFYNGLGPRGTRYHAKPTFAEHGFEHHYSWFHDWFGAADYITFCTLVTSTVLLSSIAMSWYVAGLRGTSLGSALGFIFARIALAAMNILLGASDELIELVNNELRTFRPDRSVIHVRTGSIKEDTLLTIVRDTANLLADGPPELHAKELAEQIHKEGYEVLHHVAQFLLDKAHHRSHTQSPCLRLFQTEGTTFAATEYGIAALSFIDGVAFLSAYFDPSFEVLSHMWETRFALETVYIANPRNILCMREEKGWIAKVMGSVAPDSESEYSEG